MARSVEKTGDFYAGPFLPAKLARRSMTLSHRLFGIRSCNETITGKRARPCLEYDIKRCIAPCVAEICSQGQYGVAVTNTRMLLEGRKRGHEQYLEALYAIQALPGGPDPTSVDLVLRWGIDFNEWGAKWCEQQLEQLRPETKAA